MRLQLFDWAASKLVTVQQFKIVVFIWIRWPGARNTASASAANWCANRTIKNNICIIFLCDMLRSLTLKHVSHSYTGNVRIVCIQKRLSDLNTDRKHCFDSPSILVLLCVVCVCVLCVRILYSYLCVCNYNLHSSRVYVNSTEMRLWPVPFNCWLNLITVSLQLTSHSITVGP